MIEGVIDTFVRNIGVDIILSKSVFHGLLNVFYYNWIGKDGRYYSLLAPCSDAMIYTQELVFTDEYSLDRALMSNLRVFNSKEEWHDGKWSRKYAESYNCALEKSLHNRNCEIVQVGNLRTEKILFHVQPCLGVTIWYSDGSRLNSITVWCGTVTRLVSDDLLMPAFLDELGIFNCVNIVKPVNNELLLEMEEDV